VQAVAEGRRPDGMAPDQAAVHDFLQELQANRSVSDVTYGRAVELFGERGVIDLCGICGYYSMLAMVMNVARTPLPAGSPRPLATGSRRAMRAPPVPARRPRVTRDRPGSPVPRHAASPVIWCCGAPSTGITPTERGHDWRRPRWRPAARRHRRDELLAVLEGASPS
jgi:hypothetical protein